MKGKTNRTTKQIDKPTLTVKYLNTPFSIIDRKSTQKIRKNIKDLNIINQLDLYN